MTSRNYSRVETMWATKYISIDFSSKNLAIVFSSLGGKTPFDYHYYTSQSKDFYIRLSELYKQFDYFLRNARVYYAYIEQPAIALRHKSVRMVNQASGMLLSLMLKYDVEFKEIHNKTWKKVIVGNGNCKKLDIKEYVLNKYQYDKKLPQDVCDAICIYEYGMGEGWRIT